MIVSPETAFATPPVRERINMTENHQTKALTENCCPFDSDVYYSSNGWYSGNQSQMPCAGGFISQHIHVILIHREKHGRR